MYRSKKYRPRSWEEIQADLKLAANYYQNLGFYPEKIFLCDGDALGAPMELLVKTLDKISELFPMVKRIGVYATAENILNKSSQELELLRSKKLNIAYLGLESGDDKVLHLIVKGNTSQEMKDASLKIKESGIQLSTIAMLGVGGVKYSEQHVMNTAKILGETSPHYFSFLTTFAIPGTPYFKMVERGILKRLTSKELLIEMRDILKMASFNSNPVLFRTNHVSNMHAIGGTLPVDQPSLIAQIEDWIKSTPDGVYPPPPSSM